MPANTLWVALPMSINPYYIELHSMMVGIYQKDDKCQEQCRDNYDSGNYGLTFISTTRLVHYNATEWTDMLRLHVRHEIAAYEPQPRYHGPLTTGTLNILFDRHHHSKVAETFSADALTQPLLSSL